LFVNHNVGDSAVGTAIGCGFTTVSIYTVHTGLWGPPSFFAVGIDGKTAGA
jgi:hypothetical protein